MIDSGVVFSLFPSFAFYFFSNYIATTTATFDYLNLDNTISQHMPYVCINTYLLLIFLEIDVWCE